MAVILNTSLGDIVIDLHTDLCPLTSKNFLKLCKLKYYNNCIFHDVKKDFIAQTGDPSGTGSGGDSVYKFLYGDQARFFNDEFHPKLMHDKIGTVAMASAGENLNASQFYITLRAGLDYLDGKHTVFGEVAEGLDTLMRIGEAYVDEKGQPYKNIRIKHVDILDDPFDDPPQLVDLIPENSPELGLPGEGEDVRLDDDWVPMDEQMDPEKLDELVRRKEALSRAVVLEMIGDIPEAEAAPPENVLFVCKLNPVTEEEDLKTIFSRFGKVVAADIIRDYKTGDSLCYGFIEFENKESCEAAYFKMDNVLIDDRRIHVDFSQSVSKLWSRFRKFGAKDLNGQDLGSKTQGKGGGCFNCGEYGHLRKDCPLGPKEGGEPKYTLREPAGQRGSTRASYEMVFEPDSDVVKASGRSRASDSKPGRLSSKRTAEERDDEKRGRPFLDDRHYQPGRKEGSEKRHRHDNVDSDGDYGRRSGPPSSSRKAPDVRGHQPERREGSERRHGHHNGNVESDDDHGRSGLPASRNAPDGRAHQPGKKDVSEGRHRHDNADSDSDLGRSGPSLSSRKASDERRHQTGRKEGSERRHRHHNDNVDSDDDHRMSGLPASRNAQDGRTHQAGKKEGSERRHRHDNVNSDVDYGKRSVPPASSRNAPDERQGYSRRERISDDKTAQSPPSRTTFEDRREVGDDARKKFDDQKDRPRHSERNDIRNDSEKHRFRHRDRDSSRNDSERHRSNFSDRDNFRNDDERQRSKHSDRDNSRNGGERHRSRRSSGGNSG